MKRIIAMMLAVLCLMSCMGITGYAANENIGGIVGDILDLPEQEEGEEVPLSYGIHYDLQTLTTVKLMYKPAPTITFKAPTTAKVTMDTPLSVDYEFVCWKHAETGELYYPGDEIEVTGVVTLYAVFEEKQDNHPMFIRYIITGLEALKRLLHKFLAFTNALEENDKEYYEPTTEPVPAG